MKDSKASSGKLTKEQIEEMDGSWLNELNEEIDKIGRKVYQELQDKGTELTGIKTKDRWISVTEAAKIIGVNKGTLSRWADERLIVDNVKTGRNRRIRLTSVLLLKYVREQNDLRKDIEDDLRDKANKIPDLY